MKLPEQIDLMVFFESEPELLDKDPAIPFFYNQATYEFDNGIEHFCVVISPSYGDIKIIVKKMADGEELVRLSFVDAEQFVILDDKRDNARFEIHSKRFSATLQIRPRFNMLFEEQLDK